MRAGFLVTLRLNNLPEIRGRQYGNATDIRPVVTQDISRCGILCAARRVDLSGAYRAGDPHPQVEEFCCMTTEFGDIARSLEENCIRR
jgi:hypothetical protein